MLFLAWRNFSRNLHRYRVLLAALTLVVAALVVVAGTVTGMSSTLRGKASRYFAGDLVVLGYDGSGRSLITHPDEVRRVLHEAPERAGIPVRALSERSTYYEAANALLFHQGFSARQRRFVGVEWAMERPVLETFDLVAGAIPEDHDRRGILLSSAAAASLEARVGDEVTVSVISSRRRSNTVDLLVRGIFDESSFFGFTAYMHRATLNAVLEQPEELVNEMGIYLGDPPRDEERAADVILAALEEEVPAFGILRDRDEYSEASRARREQREYGLVTLTAQLEEINDLLNAVTIIAGAMVLLFLAIVMVGVGNTYTMIVFERTREIGTLRALGMQRPRLMALFVAEALILAAVGGILGLLAGVAALQGIRVLLDFQGYGWATLFLVRGRLVWTLPVQMVGGVLGLSVAAALVGCLRSAVRAGGVHPVEAMRQE